MKKKLFNLFFFFSLKFNIKIRNKLSIVKLVYSYDLKFMFTYALFSFLTYMK